MHLSGRLARKIGLMTLAVGTVGAVVAMASFALFTSAATPQSDTFASGTVIIGQDSPALHCVVQNIEPGDSGTCTYKLTYSGSLNAWVGLNVQTSAVAAAAYRPSGSLTRLGGEALLPDRTTPGGGLQLKLSDQFHGSTPTSPLSGGPPTTCPAPDSGQEGSGPLLSGTACNSPLTTQLLASAFAGNPNHPNAQPAKSWSNGTQATVTVLWHLPLTSTDAYQGGSAEIVLQAQAVQASNNALVDGVPRSGWQGGSPSPASPAQLSILPGKQDFGTVLVGGTANQEKFTVKNTGGTSSGVPHLQVTGTDASQWQIVSNACTSALAANSGSCTVTVAFAPTVAGLMPGAPSVTATYTPVSDSATLEASASPGGSASVSMTGTTNWGCTTFHSFGVSGCQLAGVNLEGANLATLNAAGLPTPDNLSGAVLTRANLQGAFLGGDNLVDVSLLYANLSNTDLSYTNLDGANLSNANLNGDTLLQTKLRGADLSGADLSNALLGGENLSGVDLGGAHLKNAFLESVNLSGAILVEADLEGADLGSANLKGAYLSGADLSGALWYNTTCPDGTNSNNDGHTCSGHLS